MVISHVAKQPRRSRTFESHTACSCFVSIAHWRCKCLARSAFDRKRTRKCEGRDEEYRAAGQHDKRSSPGDPADDQLWSSALQPAAVGVRSEVSVRDAEASCGIADTVKRSTYVKDLARIVPVGVEATLVSLETASEPVSLRTVGVKVRLEVGGATWVADHDYGADCCKSRGVRNLVESCSSSSGTLRVAKQGELVARALRKLGPDLVEDLSRERAD